MSGNVIEREGYLIYQLTAGGLELVDFRQDRPTTDQRVQSLLIGNLPVVVVVGTVYTTPQIQEGKL